jgi:hypothetical protein
MRCMCVVHVFIEWTMDVCICNVAASLQYFGCFDCGVMREYIRKS